MEWNLDRNLLLACLLLALFSGRLCGMILKAILKLSSTPKIPCISMAGTGIFLLVHGFTRVTLMCAIVFQILLFASVYDSRTHTVPDYVHILILSVGLIHFQPLPALLGLLLVPLPFFIAALLKENSIGGGDIKLMAACGFVLGTWPGMVALVTGLFMAVLWNAVYNKEAQPFPLVPYLTMGCFVALLLI